jgi:YVTN family beta-propeller protein
MKVRSVFASFTAILAIAAGFCQTAPGASLPALTDTINPLPGPPCLGPTHIALNNVTKRAYAGGGGSIEFGANGRFTVVDAQTNSVIKNLSLPWPVYDVAVNPSSNTVYVSTASGPDASHLQSSTVVIDGATNEITKQVIGGVGSNFAVDPGTGRLFGIADTYTVWAFDGTTLSKLGEIPFNDGTRSYRAFNIVVDGGKVYVTGTSDQQKAAVLVIDASTLATTFIQTNSTQLANLTADTSLHRVYAAAIIPDGNGGSRPAILVIESGAVVKTIDLPLDDSGMVTDGFLFGATVDPVRHRAYFGAAPRSIVIDTQSNTLLGTVTRYFNEAAVLTSNGKIYATQFGSQGESSFGFENAIGVIDPAADSVGKITVGYTPYGIAANTSTGRIYVADQVGNDLLVLNAVDHSVVARVFVNANDATFGAGSRDVAVSQALNRIYVTRSLAPDVNTNQPIGVVDVVDGATNAVSSTISVGTGHALAVDDARHRLYVIAFDYNSYQARLDLYSTDNNGFTASIPLPFEAARAVAVNPQTGRVYVTGGTPNVGSVAIIDGNTNQVLKTVSAGAIPWRMAINKKTNKIYVANSASGSNDNSVTVIDGATDSLERTFQNINSNIGDAVSGVGVDDVTNTVYVSDDSNQFDVIGHVTIFDPANNYAFLGQIDLGHYPGAMVFDSTTRQMFVTNYFSGYISVLGNGVPPPPPAPLHGGLSATAFRVNGSSSPTGNVGDTVLRFTAQQTGKISGLLVHIQATTTPNDAPSWQDLPNGSKGYMTYDPGTGQFVLNSTNYPLVNGLYFRVVSSASGFPDSVSNVVGPFNLATNMAHLGPTVLFMATNGGGAEMRFRVKETSPPAGILLRIQATTTPSNEVSWTDLNDGNSGHMSPYSDSTQFYLDSTKYPTGDPVYFRAVAQASGYIDSISNEIGVTHVVNGIPPTVDVLPPRFDQLLPGTGSGTTPNDPLLVSVGTFKLGAQASSSEQKPIKRLVLLYDGVTINDAATSGDHFQMDYTTSVPGDHVVKAAATDERGVIGYADPVYLRVVPSGGKLFKMVTSGSWNNAANWQDGLGHSGVPGANDFAIIEGHDASITQNITVYSIALVSGTMNGAGGALTVSRFFSIIAGQLKNIDLTIDSSGVLAIGDTDVPISGSVTNNGKIRLRGHGSIVPVPVGANAAAMQTDGTLAADGFFDGVAAFFKNAGEFIFHHPSVKPKPKSVPSTPPSVPRPRSVTASAISGSGKLITENGGGAISHDGGSAISHDGGSLINNGGSTLIGNDGASLIGNDGASIIGNDGASLLSENGLGLLSEGGIGIKVRANGSAGSSSTRAEAATATSGYVQTGGETDLDNVVIVGAVSIDGGVLSGSGIVAGSLTNNGGYIVPGHSAGAISVTGDFTQAAQGTMVLENGGTHQGEYDRLQINGTANLGGHLEVRNINGYVPEAADTFNPFGYSAVTGSFASVTSNTQLSFGTTGAIATVNPAVPNPSTGQPLNIATRLAIQNGDKALFAGFIVTGPSGSNKKVMIRGIGPSLANFGITGTISDPLLELHKPDGSVLVNDNWQQGDTGQIPNGFGPSDERESVIVATLSPGTYSVVVKGAHGETGVGLAEVYDLESDSSAKLANIATRGLVQTGDNVLIGGFIIGGTQPAKVLVRAIGPSLAQFGVPNTLAATTLELHDANGSVISNEGWRNTQESDIIATTIPPSNDNEAAILATLAPGTYTAVVRGKGDSTGIAVVEAYNLQ